MSVRRLWTSVSSGFSVNLPHRLMLVHAKMLQGLLLRLIFSSSHAGDLALLQELFCVEGVECAQVVNHSHQFSKDCRLK